MANLDLISKDDIIIVKKSKEEGIVLDVNNGIVTVEVNGLKREFKSNEIELKDMRMI